MQKKELTRKYFDGTAADYDNSHDGRFVRGMYQEILNRAQAASPGRVLDLGCGNGNVIALLKERVSASYFGLDLSEEMIQEAKKRLGEEVFLCAGDAEQLPFETAFFDMIICNASFHHYPGPDAAILEMKRVLKPDGTIILGDPACPVKPLRDLLNWFMKYSNSGDVKIRSKKEMTALFQKHGFRIVDWKWVNYKAFVLRATPV